TLAHSIMYPAEIIRSISNKFIDARECGELVFFPSTVWKHKELGVEFEIRLCPSLQKKPVAAVDSFRQEKIKDQSDAFTPPYNPSLHVGDLQDDGTDYIVLVLSSAFLSLLDLVVSTVRHDPDYRPGKPSYNVLITLEHMHLIPRKQDVYIIPETGYEVSVNALGFAGMLLVKCEEELEALKNQSLGKVLRSVGLESVHEIQVVDTIAEAE
ncbi:hypothetical protein C0992_002223, partial [Termitomyces sp. T32_za158]